VRLRQALQCEHADVLRSHQPSVLAAGRREPQGPGRRFEYKEAGVWRRPGGLPPAAAPGCGHVVTNLARPRTRIMYMYTRWGFAGRNDARAAVKSVMCARGVARPILICC